MKTIEVEYTWYASCTKLLKVKVPDDYDPDNYNDEVNDEVESAVDEAAREYEYNSSSDLRWEVDDCEWEVVERE